MEKILSGDEKIRKAEEIYYRRKMGLPIDNIRMESPSKTYLMSKILLEILVIINLTLVIIAVQNKDFIFTQEFLEKVSAYNVNLTKSIKGFIGIEENSQVEIKNNENQPLEVIENEKNDTTNEIVPNNEPISALSQMDSDIEEIKKSYSFFKPIEGTVTSIFGARESKYQNVTGYHTGIDIGADKGTSIKASISGKVILVSNKGDYGKHIKIQNDKIQTLYAHCSEILVKENEEILVGQEIAKVGSTGNSTGPHLHFEIRYDERYIDPSRLVEF